MMKELIIKPSSIINYTGSKDFDPTGSYNQEVEWNLYTDGGSKKRDSTQLLKGETVNPSSCVASSGVVWVRDGQIVRGRGYQLPDPLCTNNQGELAGIYLGLKVLLKTQSAKDIILWTDSTYCLLMLEKDKLKTQLKKDKKNWELINLIRKLMLGFDNLTLRKIKGHNNHRGNCLADQMASSGLEIKQSTSTN